MPEENKGPNEPSNSSTQSESQSPPAPRLPVSPQNQVPTTTETNNSPSNPPESAAARELHWLEKLNFAGQLGLVIVGIIAACIYHGQLKVMQGQLDQMESSSVQTNQLICLYQQQVAELTKQATDTYDLAVAADKQATATNKLAIQAARSANTAEQSLQSNIELSREE
jgi:hypothetical protein